MKRIYCLLLGVSLLLFSCNRIEYHDDLIKIEIKSKRANCEENNIHFKVLSVSDSNYISMLNQFISPICNGSIKCEHSIYSVGNNDTLNRFVVSGFLSKYGHNEIEYGCIGSKVFKIEDVIESLSDLKIKN